MPVRRSFHFSHALVAVFGVAFLLRLLAVFPDTALAADEKTIADSLQPLPTEAPVEAPVAEDTTKTDTEAAAAPVVDDSIADKDFTEYSASELTLLQSLRKRREELAEQEKALVEKQRLLEGMEKRLETKIGKLEDIQQKIEQSRADIAALVEQGKGQDAARIASLVRVYEKMKPKEAARIFDNLELNILLDVVRKMNEGRLAPILAGMDAQKATTVTAMLGQRTEMPALAADAAAAAASSPDSSSEE